MTVLQIVKGLIGEEDVNWGNSDTTYTRQTHTGGSTSIHYIDSKSIPAHTLGGVVDTYLHWPHTDTGTTSVTFVLNNDEANYLILSAIGQTTGVTITFPTTTQAVVGATDLASTASGKGASTVGVYDTAENFTSTNVEAVLAELAQHITGQTMYLGYKRGFKLGYSSTNIITISSGMWNHKGTEDQNVYTLTQITFLTGSSGSNAASDDLTPSALHYIYIDDSAVITAGTPVLTATEFINKTTAPTWSSAKGGWYNGNDRCIGAILTTAASAIVEFYVRSNNFYAYTTTTEITEFATATAPTSNTDLDISSSVPVFSTCARLFMMSALGGYKYAFAIKGSGNYTTHVTCSTNDGTYTFDVYTNDAQVLSWVAFGGAVATSLHTKGYYIDEL